MAITGIDTIDGKQIIAAGAVSAKSAEMAYNDENGNPITGYQVAGDYYSASNPSGFITEVPDTYLQNTDLTITDGKISEISGVPLSAGSTPAYGYTNNGLISSIDSSGLYATSGSANHLNQSGTMGRNIVQNYDLNNFYYMPMVSPFGKPQGIFSPLQYATGACLAMTGDNFGAYYKGNEWYVSNNSIGQALRGEVHKSRGVHVSGATTAGYGFNLAIGAVSGVNSTGSWKYGPAEDAALRSVSSCDMHESAFGYDANDKISGYNGSAFAGGDVPEGVMVESGLEYNAVNEISGYNGSAIAQYGAEKQWLVHDDTLVHASNSAQYALGVNLSAVQTLMGLDETLLYSGIKTDVGSDGYATYTLSESPINFNKIKIYWCMRTNNAFEAGNNGIGFVEYDPNIYSADQTYVAAYMNGDESSGTLFPYRSDSNILNIRTTTWSTRSRLVRLNDNVILENNAAWFHIYKIVGIGRKQ